MKYKIIYKMNFSNKIDLRNYISLSRKIQINFTIGSMQTKDNGKNNQFDNEVNRTTSK